MLLLLLAMVTSRMFATATLGLLLIIKPLFVCFSKYAYYSRDISSTERKRAACLRTGIGRSVR